MTTDLRLEIALERVRLMHALAAADWVGTNEALAKASERRLMELRRAAD